MNRTGIEWTDFSWNPVTGCTKGCYYCYARRMAERLRGRYGYPEKEPFFPMIHRDRVEEPYSRRKAAKIFTCSMGELFDPAVPEQWIDDIFQVMNDCPQHIFQLLTKRYYRLSQFSYPENLWLGVSQDCMTTDPDAIRALKQTDARVKFVSFEPLLGPIENDAFYGLDWIVIGAQTGARAVAAKREWVEEIIDEAHYWGIPIFLKDNLQWREQIREWPVVK